MDQHAVYVTPTSSIVHRLSSVVLLKRLTVLHPPFFWGKIYTRRCRQKPDTHPARQMTNTTASQVIAKRT